MSFDEEYIDPHGECAHEIARLKAEVSRLLKIESAAEEYQKAVEARYFDGGKCAHLRDQMFTLLTGASK